MLRVLSIADARSLYRVLSYGSLLALLICAWRNSRYAAIRIVLPIVLVLAIAFDLHQYAGNMLWAPGFFVSFFVLAFFLGAKESLRPWSRRVVFFAALGVVCAYLENLQGVIVVTLSFAIVLNHFFYRRESDWRSASAEVLGIFGCFLASYLCVTFLRLALISTFLTAGWQIFAGGLAFRMGNSLPEAPHITITDMLMSLWNARAEMTGNQSLATALLVGSGIAWCIAMVFLIIRQTTARAIDFGIVATAACGIIAWYILFLSHTYGHAWIMIRLMAVPIGLGFAALLISFPLSFAGRKSEAWRDTPVASRAS
jgi:hypothetical protein